MSFKEMPLESAILMVIIIKLHRCVKRKRKLHFLRYFVPLKILVFFWKYKGYVPFMALTQEAQMCISRNNQQKSLSISPQPHLHVLAALHVSSLEEVLLAESSMWFRAKYTLHSDASKMHHPHAPANACKTLLFSKVDVTFICWFSSLVS